MKKITSFFSLLLAVFSLPLLAQNDCSNGRYLEPVFQEVVVTPGIPYGMAETTFDTLNTGGVNNYPLFLDVYQAGLDIASNPRPVIMLAFGGAFVYGARVSPDIVALCSAWICLRFHRLSPFRRITSKPKS